MSENNIPTASPEQKKLPKYMEIAHYIAAGCFGVCALSNLIVLLSYFNVFTLIYMALFGLAAFACLKKELKLPLLHGAFAGLALVRFVEMIVEIINQIKAKANGYYATDSVFSIILTALLVIFAYLAMLVFVLVKGEKTGIAFVDSIGEKLQDKAQSFEKLWFVPAAAKLVASIFGLFGLFSYCYFGRVFGNYGLIEVAALLFAAIWLLMPQSLIDGAEKAEVNRAAAAADGGTSIPADAGYIDLVKHILLLLFTFGIWNFIWIYRNTDYLNRVKGEEYRNPTTKLLLCMFIPFYSIYWTYISTQRVDKLAAENGVVSGLTTPCLIMAIFVPFAAPIVLQEKINTIISSANAPAAKAAGDSSSIDSLKKFKDLLDSGIITQEDFDAKKKQILGL